MHHLKGKLAAQNTNDLVVGNLLFGCDPAAKVFYHDLHFRTHSTRGGHDQGGEVSIFNVADALLVLVLLGVGEGLIELLGFWRGSVARGCRTPLGRKMRFGYVSKKPLMAKSDLALSARLADSACKSSPVSGAREGST